MILISHGLHPTGFFIMILYIYDFYKIKDIRLSPDDIWLPDIEVYNLVKKTSLTSDIKVVVTSDGNLTWIQPYELVTVCKLDFIFYPFDDQTCNTKFGSWVYNGFLLDLKLVSRERPWMKCYGITCFRKGMLLVQKIIQRMWSGNFLVFLEQETKLSMSVVLNRILTLCTRLS